MKIRHLLITAFFASQTLVQAEPVASTSLEEAITKAPIIVLAEAGMQQYDDLKEGAEVKTDTMAFECRKQSFKILKVYRNKSNFKLAPNSAIEVNAKSNSCIVSDITLKKQKDKLIVKYNGTEAASPPFSVAINPGHEKKILFLANGEINPKTPEHYGWFVSPQKYNEELEKKLASSETDPGKKTVHMNDGCD